MHKQPLSLLVLTSLLLSALQYEPLTGGFMWRRSVEEEAELLLLQGSSKRGARAPQGSLQDCQQVLHSLLLIIIHF